MCRLVLLQTIVLSVLAAGSSPAEDISNMNGEYILSQTPGGHDTRNKFPTHYKDYPRGVTHFDVYSPLISQLYSQVYWKGLEPVKLPEDIVQRFDGKGMAVVGFELDQVRRTSEGDVSVPISVVYNHHFESNMIGKGAIFEKATPATHGHRMVNMGHGLPDEFYVVQDLGVNTNGIPTHQSFGAANGGEVRKSFHGYAPGFAQVIHSPTSFQITPMQIDTWNREKMNISHPTKFVPGPLPRNALSPADNPQYSGLLECPVSTRIQKEVEGGYIAQVKDTCQSRISSLEECIAAAKVLLGDQSRNFTNKTISDAGKPAGCIAFADADVDQIHLFFNSAKDSHATCGSGIKASVGRAQSLVNLSVQLDVSKELATITVSGPKDVWFGVGFNATAMKDAPWAIIVEASGNVTERKLEDQGPGRQLATSVSVASSTVFGATRTVVMKRPFKGLTPEHFTFNPTAEPRLNFINAIGNGPTLAYHKEKTPSSITIFPTPGDDVGGACICAQPPAPFGQAKGSLKYVPTSQPADIGSGTVSFNNNCAPQPRSDLLAMKNPTCDLRHYAGGQIACHHMWSLLDADQEIPWADQPLEYHLKFRFWVQEYNASYHTQVQRTTWGIASPVEYDVPKCEAGMMGCSQQPDGNWVHTITGTFTGSGKLIAAHFHCHAPTCLSIAMYKCPKGTKICNETTGELLCREEPVYGGTHKIDDPRFDEPGFILQPPCLWGASEFGLEAPPDVSDFVLGSVKTSNATYGHHGEMAWQQMFYVNSRDQSTKPTFFV